MTVLLDRSTAQAAPTQRLTPTQWASWEVDGYIVVPQVLEPAEVDRAASAIWDFLEMTPDEPSVWYDDDRRRRSAIDRRGIVPLYHAQALWDCRQSPSIYAVFAELIGRRDLLVSIDRVNMNPPEAPGWSYEGFVHWDIDVSRRPLPDQLQGLVSLSDTPEGAGGFQCVAGFHAIIAEWLDAQGKGYCSRFPDISDFRLTDVPVRAGDLLVWRGALPHGNTANRGAAPRLAQYITMTPADQFSPEDIAERIRSFREGVAPRSPNGAALPASPKANALDVELSPLGRRLLGLEPW